MLLVFPFLGISGSVSPLGNLRSVEGNADQTMAVEPMGIHPGRESPQPASIVENFTPESHAQFDS